MVRRVWLAVEKTRVGKKLGRRWHWQKKINRVGKRGEGSPQEKFCSKQQAQRKWVAGVKQGCQCGLFFRARFFSMCHFLTFFKSAILKNLALKKTKLASLLKRNC